MEAEAAELEERIDASLDQGGELYGEGGSTEYGEVEPCGETVAQSGMPSEMQNEMQNDMQNEMDVDDPTPSGAAAGAAGREATTKAVEQSDDEMWEDVPSDSAPPSAPGGSAAPPRKCPFETSLRAFRQAGALAGGWTEDMPNPKEAEELPAHAAGSLASLAAEYHGIAARWLDEHAPYNKSAAPER